MSTPATNIRPRPRKRQSEKVARRNICLPPKLDQEVDTVVTKYGFSSFSDYVQARLRKDAGLELAA